MVFVRTAGGSFCSSPASTVGTHLSSPYLIPGIIIITFMPDIIDLRANDLQFWIVFVNIGGGSLCCGPARTIGAHLSGPYLLINTIRCRPDIIDLRVNDLQFWIVVVNIGGGSLCCGPARTVGAHLSGPYLLRNTIIFTPDIIDRRANDLQFWIR